MQLSKLLLSLNEFQIKNPQNLLLEKLEILHLTDNSRACEEASLFFCMQGNNIDSHSFVGEAIENGAVAIVCERELSENVLQIIVPSSRMAISLLSGYFYGKPSKKLKIVGITGTNGKTTTSYFLESIFQAAGKRTGVIGTLGIRYAKKYIEAQLTTPDPIFLQKTLADMVACGIEYVFMEVSAHALYYDKVAGVRFHTAIFTNLTQDHLDFFASMEEYKRAKFKLFFSKNQQINVINADDACAKELSEALNESKSEKRFYGLTKPTDAFAVIIDEGLFGTEFILTINNRLCRVKLKMIGRHNILNALAAAVCAEGMGLTMEEISRGLNSVERVNGRLERVACYHGGTVFVDFAHTPDGLEKSLQALKKYCLGKLICVFGCGGDRDRLKRPLMGEIAAQNSDFCVLTSDNPRYEEPLVIISEIEAGYKKLSNMYAVIPEREVAIEYALDCLQNGDVLLIAGKGGENYQEKLGIKYAYNDKEFIIKTIGLKG
jgi:UDP-N-acetylmuramoyl-L-alanyl-D-glutamate--2,6-diaminopimelate ligase